MTLTAPSTEARVQLRTEIEDELRRYFHDRLGAAEAYGDEFVQLWGFAARSVLGGKLVRPMLMIDTYEALRSEPSFGTKRGDASAANAHDDSPTSRAAVMSIAAAIELLHYCFLLHDDVIDGDLVRRGQPNLVGALVTSASAAHSPSTARGSTLHWARSGGVLMGDLLLAGTHQSFARVRLPHNRRERLLDLLDSAITESVAGEHLDVGLGDGMVDANLATILRMCDYKTSAYTFELPLRAAAVLAGAGDSLELALAAAGRHLGLAFQLQDDLLSTFGEHIDHGKDPFSDLREGKQTALIAFARTSEAWTSIEPSFGSADLSITDGLRLRGLLAQCGADRFVSELIEAQLEAFHDAIGNGGDTMPVGVEQVLTALAHQLEGRRA